MGISYPTPNSSFKPLLLLLKLLSLLIIIIISRYFRFNRCMYCIVSDYQDEAGPDVDDVGGGDLGLGVGLRNGRGSAAAVGAQSGRGTVLGVQRIHCHYTIQEWKRSHSTGI